MVDLKEKVKSLPLLPGVYLMKDASGHIIYVGKATKLKNRVGSYFHSLAGQAVKVAEMVARVRDFDYIVTDTELEALILENNLIKLHKPKYNFLLKDDKTYPFLKITMNRDYPRMTLVRERKDDGARYFGPYSGGGTVREIIATAQRIFGIATCKKEFPRDIGKGRPCINYHIGRCVAPCTGEVPQQEYRELFSEVVRFVQGNYDEVIRELREKMEEEAEALRFEKAAALRDRIRHIERLGQRQKVMAANDADRDILASCRDGFKVCVALLNVRYGRLIDKHTYVFDDAGEGGQDIFAEFVKRYYTGNSAVPKQIVLERDFPDRKLLEQALREQTGSAVSLRVPQKGELAGMVSMARQNAAEALSRVVTREEKAGKNLLELKKTLGLERLPVRIEAYDVSNTGADNIVGGMVVFENGSPLKKAYRKFKIRSLRGPDDYTAMKEMVYRRLSAAEEEAAKDAGGEKWRPLPDLILLDGGAGHVSSVLAMLNELGVEIPVFGMVKNASHRTRDLVGPGGEIGLSPASPVFALIGAVQEEAHRFAVSYHRSARGKKSMSSLLEGIPGLGPKRRAALLKRFGSLKAVREAGLEDLAAVPGISGELAEKIRGAVGTGSPDILSRRNDDAGDHGDGQRKKAQNA